MIHVESGRYLALNATATEAWRILETPQDAAGVAASLAERFDVDPETSARSVETLLGTMHELQLVEPVA